MTFGDDIAGVESMTAAMSLLCLVAAVVLYYFHVTDGDELMSTCDSTKVNHGTRIHHEDTDGKDKFTVRSVSQRFIHGVEAMGFSIVDVQSDANSMFAALADQLAFYDLEQPTAEVVRSKAVAYVQTQYSKCSSPESRYKWIPHLKRKDEYGDDVMLHAVANAYDLTIEIIQDKTLESRIIRPESYISTGVGLRRTVYIGYIGQNYYISLRKNKQSGMESVKKDGDELMSTCDLTKVNHGTRIHHEDTDGNRTDIVIPDRSPTSIGVGDNQYIECNGEYQKYVVIPVGRDTNISIPCKLRTAKEVIECAKHFHENRSEFSGANLLIRITCSTNSSEVNDAYEDVVIETLQEERAAFQHEVDLALDVDIVRIEKECILLVFKPRSEESLLQFPNKFFSKEFERVLSYIFSLPKNGFTPPSELDICMDIEFEAKEREPTPYDNSVATNRHGHLTLTTEEQGINKIGLSKGFSIEVRPKSKNSISKLRLEHMPEQVVKAALTCIETKGMLKPKTEVEVTFQNIECKCQKERQFEVRPWSSQKGLSKKTVLRSLPKKDIFEDLDYLEAGKMTGIIKGSNGLTATAIRAGEHHVLTTNHFVSAAVHNQMEVFFRGETKGHKVRLVFSNSELDVALLEIMTPPKAVNPVVYITDASPGDDIYIVGHASRPKGLKKERTTCLNWKNINVSSACEKYVLFHSEKFREGSSGAPCLKIQEGKLCVVSLVIGELLSNNNKEIAHLGVNMLTFYNTLFQQNQELCQTIFKIVSADTDMCRFCRAD